MNEEMAKSELTWPCESTEIYGVGMVALISFENTLSFPLASTAVTT
jgi:hypothetical protein